MYTYLHFFVCFMKFIESFKSIVGKDDQVSVGTGVVNSAQEYACIHTYVHINICTYVHMLILSNSEVGARVVIFAVTLNILRIFLNSNEYIEKNVLVLRSTWLFVINKKKTVTL